MAIVHQQTQNAVASASGTATLNLTTTPGNAVIVTLMRNGSTGTATPSGAPATALTSRVNVQGSGMRTTQYTNYNIVGGSETYTFTFAATEWRLVVSEFSGLDTTQDAADAQGTMALTIFTPPSTNPLHVVASGATTNANDLLYAAWNGDGSGTSSVSSTNGDDSAPWTVPTGGSVMSGTLEFAVAYLVVSATGTYGCTLITGDGFVANSTLGAYKASADTDILLGQICL